MYTLYRELWFEYGAIYESSCHTSYFYQLTKQKKNQNQKPTTKKPGFLGEVFKNKQKNMLLEIKSTDI